MQFLQTYQLPLPQNEDNHHIGTPTKKNKKQFASQMKTADSIVLTDQKSHSLNEIDAQQLFERFHQIIRISEVQEEQDEDQNQHKVYRKLNYDNSNPKKAIKLQFSPDNSSMTKKGGIQTGKCLVNQVKGKQLFEIMPVLSPIKRKCVLQTEALSSQNEPKNTSTPKKLAKSNSHCEMAARKQSPFRDLTNRI